MMIDIYIYSSIAAKTLCSVNYMYITYPTKYSNIIITARTDIGYRSHVEQDIAEQWNAKKVIPKLCLRHHMFGQVLWWLR